MKLFIFFLMSQSILSFGMHRQITATKSLIDEALKFDHEIKNLQQLNGPKTPEEKEREMAEWKQEVERTMASTERRSSSDALTLGALKEQRRMKFQSMLPTGGDNLSRIKAYKKAEEATRFLAVLPQYKTIKSCIQDQPAESDSEEYAAVATKLDIIALGSVAMTRAKEKYEYVVENAEQQTGSDSTLTMQAELDKVSVSHLVELKNVILVSCGCDSNDRSVSDTPASILRAIQNFKYQKNIQG